MTVLVKGKLAAEKQKVFDSPYETEGYKNGISVAETICSELIARDDAEKPVAIQVSKHTGYKIGLCPDCHKNNVITCVSEYDIFCNQCGKKLDWSEK